MAQLVAIYRTPADPAAFDEYYHATHLPLAKKVPGLRKYEISDGPVARQGGGSDDVHLVAILHFDSMADLQKGFASPEGQAAAADTGNFATGGLEMLMFQAKEV